MPKAMHLAEYLQVMAIISMTKFPENDTDNSFDCGVRDVSSYDI